MPKGRGRPKKNLEIVNTVFTDLRDDTEDIFWKETLMRASQDVFPPKIKFSNGLLIYTKDTRISHQLDLGQADIDDVINFFRNHAGIFSDADINITPAKKEVEQMTWAKTSSKVRMSKVDIYVTKLYEKGEITKKEMDTMYACLANGIGLNQLPVESVTMKGLDIADITGIGVRAEAENKPRLFEITNPKIKKVKEKNSGITIGSPGRKTMGQLFDKAAKSRSTLCIKKVTTNT